MDLSGELAVTEVLAVYRPVWHSHARCHGERDLMFDPSREAEAKALCQGCEVRLPCLRSALEEPEVGVWGGTTERERRRMLGRRRPWESRVSRQLRA